MTIQEFQIKNGEWLRTIILDQKGQQFMTVLASMRPIPSESPHLHLYADKEGQRKGYEGCIRNIMALTQPPRVQDQPEANYGIPDAKPEVKLEAK